MITLLNKSVSIRKKPINYLDKDNELFNHEYSRIINETHLLKLRRVFILNGMIFNLFSFRFYDSYSLVHSVFFKQRIKNLLLLKRKTFFLENAIWITDENAYGYFHWLTDCLPRLIASENYITNHSVVLPLHLKKNLFIHQSLIKLNVAFYYYDTVFPLKIKNLILPSHVAPSGNYNVEIINKVRQQFIGIEHIFPTKRIYISRQKALKRKIINEVEVVSFLKNYNFEIHYFEEYTLDEQIELMKHTKILVGLHGAGLTNILFMQAKTSLLELRNENDKHNNCYYSLASDLDIDYYYQTNSGDKKETHEVNIKVDILLLQKNIDLIIK